MEGLEETKANEIEFEEGDRITISLFNPQRVRISVESEGQEPIEFYVPESELRGKRIKVSEEVSHR